MTSKARLSSSPQIAGGMFIDHATIVEDDFEWMAEVERLTLWNVKVPADFLPRLKKLWWVDWRGGGKSQQIEQLVSCSRLRYLSLNQIRGVHDLQFLSELVSLSMLNIYGMSAVERLPSLGRLTALRRLEIGQMKRLECIHPVLDAPRLEELLLIRKLSLGEEDLEGIKSHPTLRAFDWFAEDVPVKVWEPVKVAIQLPLARPMHPEEWFSL